MAPRFWLCLAIAVAVTGSGCASRGDPEALEARLRQQESFIADLEKELSGTRTDLQVTRKEADSLRTQLADRGRDRLVSEQAAILARAESIKLNPLLTRGVDNDGEPGDEGLSVLLMPVDKDGELIKLPGVVDLQLVDLSLPTNQQRLGQWSFPTSETREHWHRGFVSAGFLFQMDWQRRPVNRELILHAALITPDGRRFTTSTPVTVAPPLPTGMAQRTPNLDSGAAKTSVTSAERRPARGRVADIQPASHADAADAAEPVVTADVSSNDDDSETPTSTSKPEALPRYPVSQAHRQILSPQASERVPLDDNSDHPAVRYPSRPRDLSSAHSPVETRSSTRPIGIPPERSRTPADTKPASLPPAAPRTKATPRQVPDYDQGDRDQSSSPAEFPTRSRAVESATPPPAQRNTSVESPESTAPEAPWWGFRKTRRSAADSAVDQTATGLKPRSAAAPQIKIRDQKSAALKPVPSVSRGTSRSSTANLPTSDLPTDDDRVRPASGQQRYDDETGSAPSSGPNSTRNQPLDLPPEIESVKADRPAVQAPASKEVKNSSPPKLRTTGTRSAGFPPKLDTTEAASKPQKLEPADFKSGSATMTSDSYRINDIPVRR